MVENHHSQVMDPTSTWCVHPVSLVMGASARAPDSVERSVREGNRGNKQNEVRRGRWKRSFSCLWERRDSDPGSVLPMGRVWASRPLAFSPLSLWGSILHMPNGALQG